MILAASVPFLGTNRAEEVFASEDGATKATNEPVISHRL